MRKIAICFILMYIMCLASCGESAETSVQTEAEDNINRLQIEISDSLSGSETNTALLEDAIDGIEVIDALVAVPYGSSPADINALFEGYTSEEFMGCEIYLLDDRGDGYVMAGGTTHKLIGLTGTFKFYFEGNAETGSLFYVSWECEDETITIDLYHELVEYISKEYGAATDISGREDSDATITLYSTYWDDLSLTYKPAEEGGRLFLTREQI